MRRSAFKMFLGFGAMLAACLALAQAYPVKPIRFVVPYPPGGGSDLLTRPLAQKLAEKWGQSVVVDNRSGATGMIGTEIAARSPPDGYTLLTGSSAEIAINIVLYPKMAYNSERDFTPVTLLAISPLVLVVHPSLPAKSVQEFIALAKRRPGEIGYATSGPGGPHHMAGEEMKLIARIEIIHVPYKGGGPQLVDLMGGHVHSGFLALPVVAPHVKAGKLRALAVTSAKRSSAIPAVPTLDESGVPGLDISQWWGILVPTGTPREIVGRLHAEFAGLIQSPDIKARMAELGAEPVGSTGDQFDQFIRSEIAKYRKIIKEARITVN